MTHTITPVARRRRRPLVLLGLFLAAVPAVTVSWVVLTRVMEQRVEDCRRGLLPDSDAWISCSDRGSWFG